MNIILFSTFIVILKIVQLFYLIVVELYAIDVFHFIIGIIDVLFWLIVLIGGIRCGVSGWLMICSIIISYGYWYEYWY